MSQATFPVQPISYFESNSNPLAKAIRALLVFGIVLGFISLASDYHVRFYNSSIFFAFGQRESDLMFHICVAVNSVLAFTLLTCCVAGLKFRIWALRGLIIWAWARLALGVIGIAVVLLTLQTQQSFHSSVEQFSGIMLKLLPEIGAEARVLVLPVLILILLRSNQARELFESRQME